MAHNALNKSLIVDGNNPLWNREEKEAIIERAVEIYDIKQTEKGLSTKSNYVSEKYG